MSAPLRFAFDYISPYAYIAWTLVHDVAAKHDRQVEPLPVLFAGLLNAHGQKGPAEIPAKRMYVFKDAARKARRAGLPPLVPPPTHPFLPLLALRVSSLDLEPTARKRLISALFSATWAGRGGAETPAQVAAAVRSAGLEPDDLLSRAVLPETKQRLRDQTDGAIAEGVFGVPTVIADGELFWGVDGLESLDEFLAGRDPISNASLLQWADLEASATR